MDLDKMRWFRVVAENEGAGVGGYMIGNRDRTRRNGHMFSLILVDVDMHS
jgi:hypothetical protein